MGENEKTEAAGLAARARALRERGAALKDAPILSRMGLAADLAEDVAAFLVDLAAAVEALTPYLDETAEGGAENA